MKTKIHTIAGAITFVTIAAFWISTVSVEIFGSYQSIATVKNAIVWAMVLLIPSMMAVGISGILLGQGRTGRLVAVKTKRMRFAAINGICLLFPAAMILNHWASMERFDFAFYAVQALELIAGTINLYLLGRNFKDGFRLSGRQMRIGTFK